MAKKQVCITVLMRPPMPDSRATLLASMTKKRACCSINRRCTFCGKCCQTLLLIERRVEQERSAGREVPEHVIRLEQERLMAGDEVAPADKIGRSDRARAEAQMRDRHRAGFFRIVNKISLGKVVGVFADDFDRLLVRPDRAVGAEAEKQRADDIVGLDREIRIEIQTGVRDIVVDADREMIFRRRFARDCRTPL